MQEMSLYLDQMPMEKSLGIGTGESSILIDTSAHIELCPLTCFSNTLNLFSGMDMFPLKMCFYCFSSIL